MQQKDIEQLLKKYQSGEATPEEIAFLESWYAQWNEKIPAFISPEHLAEDLQLISLNVEPLNEIHRQPKIWPRMAAAAVLLIISATAYLFLHEQTPQKQVAQIQPQVIVPGHNQATLTLANGQKIVLSKGLSGKLAQQGTTQISVNGKNEVVYSGSGTTAIQYNTLSTTKGEQSPYPLVLADGTKVWLNSNSSITFPTAFNGSNRQVKIIGEAYFEVTHNASKPFSVKAGNQIVEDIGTAFNINSYADEPGIRTTLIEGSVKVIANGGAKILSPGQRSLVTKDAIFTQSADGEAETAWVSGKFIFHDEELHGVMRQLERWYNIEVVYDYDPKNVLIDGRFSKSRNISQILKAFVQTGAVKFKIQGNTVRVTK